jgi:predicted phosphohydrolase
MSIKLWAISDLHLNFAAKSAERSDSANSLARAKQVESHWRACVRKSDLVLIPGDISMAGNHRDVQPDLAWLARLPGTKVLAPGNHDRWWNNAEAVRRLMRREMYAVQGDAFFVHGLVIAGARGASPDDRETIWRAETAALERSLAEAVRLAKGEHPICVLWHHPPFDKFGQATQVVDLLEAAGAAACVYGHVHQMYQWSTSFTGMRNGIRYACVTADAIGFQPLRVELPSA